MKKLSGLMNALASIVFQLVFAAALSAQTTAGSIHPRIIFGTPMPTANSAVVKVHLTNSQGSFLCSGSVISSHVVLTASHCVQRSPHGMSVVAGDKRFAVRKVIIHPDAHEDRTTGLIYNDMALLVLSKPVRVKPLALLASRDVVSGDALTILGFGLDENGFLGTLRKGSSVVDGSSTDFIVTVFNPGESNSCSGDSGGPAIFSYRDAGGALHSGIVGITSAGTTANCTFGDQTFYANMQSDSAINFVTSNDPKATVL